MARQVKRTDSPRALAAFVAAIALLSPLHAQQSPLQPIVAEQGTKRRPAVSPDGRWLVYESIGAEGRRLLRIRLDAPPGTSPEPFAVSAMDTDSPAFSPDGAWLAFRSTRDDAFGDIYAMRWPDGAPRRLTARGTEELDPQWRDSRTLTFRSGPPGETQTRYAKAPDAEQAAPARPLPADALGMPFAPPFPVLATDPSRRFAVVAADNTNRDAAFDATDEASVWEYLGAEAGWRPRTGPIPGLAEIASLPDGAFVVAAAPQGVRDLYRAERDAELEGTAAELLARADAALLRGDAQRPRALTLLRAAAFAEPKSAEGRAALLRWLRLEIELDRPAAVERAWCQFRDDLAGTAEAQAFAVLRAEAAVAAQRAGVAEEGAPTFDELLRESQALVATAASPRTKAQALYVEALVLAETQRRADAVERLLALERLLSLPADADVLCRAQMLRAELFVASGARDEAKQALLRAMRDGSSATGDAREAARRFLRLAGPENAPFRELARNIRNEMASAPELILLQFEGALRVAELERRAGRVIDAEEALRGAVAATQSDAALHREAQERLAVFYTELRRFDDAVAVYRALGTEAAVLSADAGEARAGLVAQLAARGAEELRLGDASLSRATFLELLSIDPRSVVGWRGVLNAEAALGTVAERVAAFDRETRERKDDALAWYKLGFAASFVDAKHKDTLRFLERAVAIDPRQPYYHQTLGYVCEQHGNETGVRDWHQRAFDAYATALALLSPADNPQGYADLLLNAGNAAMNLQRFPRAAESYRRRDEQGVPFANPMQELLYRRNYGVAAFRAYDSNAAQLQLGKALALLRDKTAIFPPEFTQERRAELLRELLDRRALALAESARFEESEAAYAELATLTPRDSVDRVRVLRNRALAMMKRAQRTEGALRMDILSAARALLEEALATAGEPTLQAAAPRGDGLLSLSMNVSVGAGDGGARLDLTRADEERLIRGALAQIAEQQGRRGAVEAELRSQLALEPRLDDESRTYYLTQRAATLSALAEAQLARGENAAAARSLLDALAATQYEVKGTPIRNTGAATRILLRMAELALRDASAFDGAPLAEAWPLKIAVASTAPAAPLARLDAMAQALLSERSEGLLGEAPALGDAQQRARLHLLRALARERLGLDALRLSDRSTLGDLRSAATASAHFTQALGAVQSLRALAPEAADPRETNRLLLLADGVGIRIAAQSDLPELARQRLDAAEVAARARGQEGLFWWLRAQEAHALPPGDARDAASERTIAALEDTLPGALPREMDLPWAFLESLEASMLQSARERGDDIAIVELTERWRVVRRRLLFSHAVPTPRSEGDAEWLARLSFTRAQYRGALERLQGLGAATAPTPALLEQLDTAREAMRTVLAEGIGNARPTALLLHPQPSPFDNVALALEAASVLPERPALLLNRRAAHVSFTKEITAKGLAEFDAAALAERAKLWFVLGEPLADEPPSGVSVVTLVDTGTFLASLDRVPLSKGAEPTIVANAAAIGGEARLATAVEVGEALRVSSASPLSWLSADSSVPLPSLLDALEAPELLRLDRFAVETANDAERRVADLALASLLAQRGVLSARWPSIDGTRETKWLGMLFDPAAAPETAQTELQFALGRAGERFAAGQYAAAVPYYRSTVVLLDALGEREQLPMQEQYLAECYARLGRFDLAIGPERSAASALRKSGRTAELAESLMRLGSHAAFAREYATAKESYREAAEVLHSLGDERRALDAAVRAGVAEENGSEYAAALATFERTLEAARALGDSLLEAEQWRRIARLQYLRLNRYTEAETATRAAMEAATRAIAEAPDAAARERAEHTEAEVRLDLSRIFEKTGLYADSLRLVDEVVALAEQREDDLLLGLALLDRANVNWLRSDYLASFNAQREALEVARRIEDIPLEVAIHQAEGLTHWSLNDYTRAMLAFDKALELAEAQGLDHEVATTHNNRGLVERSRKNFDAALASFGAALAIDERQRSLWGQAYSHRNIGITHLDAGRPAEALAPLERAIALADSIGDRTSAAKARLALGDALRKLSRAEESRAAYDAALAEARAVPLPEVQWRAEYGLAMLLVSNGEREAAQQSLARAIDVLEALRAAIRVEEFQDGFLADKQAPYDAMVALLLDLGRTAAAFEFSERARGRNFIDLLGNAKLDLSAGGDDRLLARERELRAAVESLERKLGAAIAADREALAKSLSDARVAYSDFLVELRAANPQLSAFVRVEPVSAAEVQQLLDPGTKMLAYHLLEDEIVAWVLSRDSIAVTRTPVRRAELSTRIESLRSRLQDFAPVDAELAILGRALLEPSAPALEGAKRIAIVPHRELHAMPFAALPLSGAGAIIDRYALYFAPSASVLRYTIPRRPGQSQRDTAADKMLAIGNPDLGSAALDLPFAQKEAERLSIEYPGARLVTGGEATESWVAENIGDYAIVHIASHGEYDPNAPLFSSVRLSADAQNDGVLTAAEVFSLGLRADLVSLSACQTGLGRLSNGDDIVGLNRAFVYAGTRQLLSSLWRVDDISTAVTIKHFYRNMRDLDRAEALRQAQLRVRRRFPHPAHWASLTLTGDWQ